MNIEEFIDNYYYTMKSHHKPYIHPKGSDVIFSSLFEDDETCKKLYKFLFEDITEKDMEGILQSIGYVVNDPYILECGDVLKGTPFRGREYLTNSKKLKKTLELDFFSPKVSYTYLFREGMEHYYHRIGGPALEEYYMNGGKNLYYSCYDDEYEEGTEYVCDEGYAKFKKIPNVISNAWKENQWQTSTKLPLP